SRTPSFRGSVRPAALGDAPIPWGRSPPITKGGEAPTGAGAERRTRWLPCGKARPFSGREQPAHDADRRAYRRFAAAFFLRPRDRLLETDRGAHSNALDSTGFPPLSSAPPARCRTDPCSWAGRCLPRPPEAWLARPNPQAPSPFHHLDASRWHPHVNGP